MPRWQSRRFWNDASFPHETGATPAARGRRDQALVAADGQCSLPAREDPHDPADGGGSNDSRVRLEKIELGKPANELGLVIPVPHPPPGTSKWNKIEHRLFSFITANWRGRCEHPNTHPAGGKVSGAELEAVAIVGREFPARGIT